MERVVVSNPFVSLLAMQVCAVKDATDEEILKVCNDKNEAGTSNGWGTVLRANWDLTGDGEPVQCVDHEERLHFIILC